MCVSVRVRVCLPREETSTFFFFLFVAVKVDLTCSSAPTGTRVTLFSEEQRPSQPARADGQVYIALALLRFEVQGI